MNPVTPRELIEVLGRPLAQMPAELELCPVQVPFKVEISPPGSKSLTNRALLLAALSNGEVTLDHCLIEAVDARVMIEALRQLGATITVENEKSGRLRVVGAGGKLKGGQTLQLQNAGTATRFLAAVVCLADAPVVIDGNERMRQRPIGELAAMLRSLGITVEELGRPGFVPLRIHPCRPDGGVLEVGITQSSQFISALMMLAPFTAKGIEFRFLSEPTSRSYIEMTETLMSRACTGYTPDYYLKDGGVRMPPKPDLTMNDYRVEPDASGATYFFGAAAVIPGSRCLVQGMGLNSLQADAEFVMVMDSMGAHGKQCCDDDLVESRGALHGTLKDMSLMPDAAMTAAAVACFATGTTELRGLRTLRVKETDRLAAMQTELSKLGVRVEIESYTNKDGVKDELIRITPPTVGIDCSAAAPRVVFDTYDDHRMAMSLAIIGLRRPNVVIRDPACVAKTYPTFWNDWARLYCGK